MKIFVKPLNIKILLASALGLFTLQYSKNVHAESGFDVNDVSILFPVQSQKPGAATPKLYPDLGLKIGPHIIVSQNLFNDLNKKMHRLSHVDSRLPYQNWRIVGLRFDPCFPKSNERPITCIHQIRLVAQPFSGGFVDLAMHLLFQIGEGQMSTDNTALREILEIKRLSAQWTKGRPLLAHPGLQAEEKNAKSLGPIARKISNLIVNNCSPSNLREVTFTDAKLTLNGPWFFAGGIVEKDRWNPQPIPLLNNSMTIQETSEFGLTKEVPDPNKSLGFLIDENSTREQSHVTEQEIRLMNQIENPEMSHPRNMDCASCHLTNAFQMNQRVDSISGMNFYRSPKGITGYSLKENHPYINVGMNTGEVVRLFGYAILQPIIAPIVANSSAAVAGNLNQLLGLSTPTARNCQGQEQKLRACLLGLDIDYKKIDEAACFESFCVEDK